MIVECRGCPARIEVIPLEDRPAPGWGGWCPNCGFPIPEEEK